MHFKYLWFIWLCQVLVVVCVNFIASRGIFCYAAQTQWLQHVGSAVVVYGPCCSTACGILVPWLRFEPASPALQGGFLTPDPWRSLDLISSSLMANAVTPLSCAFGPLIVLLFWRVYSGLLWIYFSFGSLPCQEVLVRDFLTVEENSLSISKNLKNKRWRSFSKNDD